MKSLIIVLSVLILTSEAAHNRSTELQTQVSVVSSFISWLFYLFGLFGEALRFAMDIWFLYLQYQNGEIYLYYEMSMSIYTFAKHTKEVYYLHQWLQEFCSFLSKQKTYKTSELVEWSKQETPPAHASIGWIVLSLYKLKYGNDNETIKTICKYKEQLLGMNCDMDIDCVETRYWVKDFCYM